MNRKLVDNFRFINIKHNYLEVALTNTQNVVDILPIRSYYLERLNLAINRELR